MVDRMALKHEMVSMPKEGIMHARYIYDLMKAEAANALIVCIHVITDVTGYCLGLQYKF